MPKFEPIVGRFLRIARASAFGGIVPSGSTTFAITSLAGGAMPAMPAPLSAIAAISPATKVPWPNWSFIVPPTKLFDAAIRPRSSGWLASIPESITATRTGKSDFAASKMSSARSRPRYHWRGTSGSFGGVKGRTQVPQLVDRWLAGEIDVESLLSHRLTLDEVNRGFELMEEQAGIRSVITF